MCGYILQIQYIGVYGGNSLIIVYVVKHYVKLDEPFVLCKPIEPSYAYCNGALFFIPMLNTI